MSALGQKRIFRSAIAMSALPPKADMCGALAHVRFGPEADIGQTCEVFTDALGAPIARCSKHEAGVAAIV
jgi:hypothetical protein